jgi:hypothetical protein
MDDSSRNSLNKALISKNYSHAFNKIKNNITKFTENLQKLQDILQKLSNNNNNNNYDESTINTLIPETSNLLTETFDLINDIKEFNYDNKNEKIENITEANNLNDECNYYKNIFENLINKIKIKNTRLIRKAKNSLNSFFGSNMSINSNNSFTNNNINNTNSNNNNNNNNSIEKKLSINKIIEMTNFKLNSKLERRNTIKDFLINETKYENIDEKNNEKYVNSILTANHGNCFTRNFGYILFIFVIIIVIICIYFDL